MRDFPKLFRWPLKFLIWAIAGGITLAFFSIVSYFVSAISRGYRIESPESFQEMQIDRLEASLESKLARHEYGMIEHSMWTELFAQSFYAYGRANRYEHAPDEAGRLALVQELDRVYRWIDTEERIKFRAVGKTGIENGIIYQGHRLHVLALLAKYRGDPDTLRLLDTEAKKVSAVLAVSPRFTAESYPRWAWWVDNIDAYYALHLADRINRTDDYRVLTDKWIAEIKSSLDASGNVLAEAYGPYMAENQARSWASAWLLTYMDELNPWFFQEQQPKFEPAFGTERFWLRLLSEVPAGQEFVNSVPTGPVLFGASSAGTLLSLAYYRKHDPLRANAILHTIETLFWYDRESWEILGGVSTMLESSLYWGLSFGK